MDKIDFVLPWVDSSDKAWQEEKNKYNPNYSKEAAAEARFRDMETLKYVLRGIEQNAPWYNKIYLITQGHYPKWLDINHKKIVLVTHKELFFDSSHLPTFNSQAIEMNLANLKDLSEKFVYLNDDMIIIRKVSSRRFFRGNKPVDFLAHGWIPRNRVFRYLRRVDEWVYAINNNLELINKTFDISKLEKKYLYDNSYSFKDKISNFLMKNIYKKIIWLEHWHHPQPYLKQTLQEVYNRFKKEMMISSKNRFRAKSDLNPYLYRYWQLISGNFYPKKYNDALVANLSSLGVLEKLIKKIETNPKIKFVCFNDDINLQDDEYEKVKQRVKEYLESKLPEKASFEKE